VFLDLAYSLCTMSSGSVCTVTNGSISFFRGSFFYSQVDSVSWLWWTQGAGIFMG
jgi:hypothetical protein